MSVMASVVGKPITLMNLSGANSVVKRTMVPVSGTNGTAVIVTNNSPQQLVKTEPGITRILVEERGSVLVNNTTNANNDLVRCKRRINFSYSGIPGHQPASVARRNARERNRVKQVNNGFATLRSHIPLSVAAALTSNASGRGASKKLSKVETLRMAVEYIRSLQELLDESGSSGQSENHGYYPSPSSENQQEQASLSPPPCSEASSSPPPSSYASEGSYNAPASVSYQQDNYEPMSPEDEELLDVISWWQQSQ